MDMASTCVLFLTLKNLVSVNFRLRKVYGELQSRGGAVYQNVEQHEEKCRVRQSKMQSKGDMCFILIPNWSLALRQAHLNEVMDGQNNKLIVSQKTENGGKDHGANGA